MKKLALLLFILFLWLQYSLWLGKNGILDLFSVYSDILMESHKKAKLNIIRAQLFTEVNDFNHGKGYDAIEEHSRHELDMIKPGETFYRLVSIPPPIVQAQKEKK